MFDAWRGVDGRPKALSEGWRGVDGRCEALSEAWSGVDGRGEDDILGLEKLVLPTAAAAAAAAMLTFGDPEEFFLISGRSE